MEKVPISVVVITKNEEHNIEDCLKSALSADEIIVVDDGSADRTVELAKKFTDKVFSRSMDNEGRHRNYAYSLAKNDWVLSLDADERISPLLMEELRQLFKNPIKDVVFAIPHKAYLGKKWLRYGGWYPAGKDRLFDKRVVRFEEKGVHPRIIYHGTCGRFLKGDIIHYSYENFHAFFQTLNNQTTLEAKKWFEERRRIGALKAFRKFLSRFLRYYIFEQGFRDGLVGFMAAFGGGYYQWMSYVKYWEMLQNEGKVESDRRPECPQRSQL
ncbi:MAG: glycosyltransferase family 2 protein [Candidatus Omnitrophica bacterium]|nr:glycosyltransferase family 2 protein [Candidatus Omnitrophota bacterium]